MKKTKLDSTKNIICVSDTHIGCKLALCPDEVRLDEGGTYHPSTLQKKINAYWKEFWGSWVPLVTEGEPFAVVMNGDAIDGDHHGISTTWSRNIEDQISAAVELFAPVVEACEGRYYHIRGTAAHVGEAGQNEERLARRLGAIPNETGQYARYELWKSLGGSLIHFLHHVGTTSRIAYKTSAPMGELTEMITAAALQGERIPDVIVRSHRHDYVEITVPKTGGKGGEYCRAVTTPCWQGKTDYSWKHAGARVAVPQFGGICIRVGVAGFAYIQHKIWSVERGKIE